MNHQPCLSYSQVSLYNILVSNFSIWFDSVYEQLRLDRRDYGTVPVICALPLCCIPGVTSNLNLLLSNILAIKNAALSRLRISSSPLYLSPYYSPRNQLPRFFKMRRRPFPPPGKDLRWRSGSGLPYWHRCPPLLSPWRTSCLCKSSKRWRDLPFHTRKGAPKGNRGCRDLPSARGAGETWVCELRQYTAEWR